MPDRGITDKLHITKVMKYECKQDTIRMLHRLEVVIMEMLPFMHKTICALISLYAEPTTRKELFVQQYIHVNSPRGVCKCGWCPNQTPEPPKCKWCNAWVHPNVQHTCNKKERTYVKGRRDKGKQKRRNTLLKN